MDYLVVYTSNTGNTQKVAMKIFKTLPGKSKDIVSLEELHGEEADTGITGEPVKQKCLTFFRISTANGLPCLEPAGFPGIKNILNRWKNRLLFFYLMIMNILAVLCVEERWLPRF